METQEIWKQIEKYPEYEVSSLGRFRNIKTKQSIGLSYPVVGLKTSNSKTTRRVYVHRVLAETFIQKPNCEEKLLVNHKDGVKINYSLDNLEWITASENVKHAYSLGLQIPRRKVKIAGPGRTYNKRRVIQVQLDNSEIEFESAKEAFRQTGINHTKICAVCRGERKRAGGYAWKYK